MKTLIMTTGNENRINRWLLSLRSKGMYNGDVLLFDYDGTLHEQQNVIVIETKMVYDNFISDRFRAYYEYLKDKWENYDVIMATDGNDVEFFKSIQPLLEMATEKFCYAKEITINWHLYEWKVLIQNYSNADKIWDKMMREHTINMGIILGPSKMMFETVEFINKQLSKYNNHLSCDQLLLNALIYYYNPFPNQAVDDEWNYDGRNGYSLNNGKCYSRDGKEISILHMIHPSKKYWEGTKDE